MSYDPRVVNAIFRIGQRRGEKRRYILGALDTGIVESGLRNLPGGDADSYGFRQQRESIYGRQGLGRQIKNLFNEFHQYDRGQSLGNLIADVQRPAAQYRGRYADVMDEARRILNSHGFSGGGGSPVTGGGQGFDSSPSSSKPNIFEFLANFNANTTDRPNDPVQQQLQQGWNLLAELSKEKGGPLQTGVMGSGVGDDGGKALPGLAAIVRRMNHIDKVNNKGKLPYAWGGGHQRKGGPLVPLDCSGAVSRVLGINPMVAQQFEAWGRPGRGKHITIWASDGHVLMEKDGHFWGTSAANPGGGAGWIPAGHISASYLRGFTPRHPRGL